ncbi:MAG: MaoC family dehydratase N-terminal domain-containing protein [Dehalococcoidales bacterium]|nr:MaoC family dehydratase N-terminal domain-containing protein [Dehalococcoidales bacterium]
MTEQLYYQDVAVGGEITPLVKQPTTMQLVMWAGASGDYNPIHYDKDFAQSRGLSGVIVPGQLIGAFLGQLMTDWIGEGGSLRKLSCSYKGMNYPGEAVTCKGKVTKKYVQNGQHFVECSLWAENPKGEKTASGKAMVILPSRG